MSQSSSISWEFLGVGKPAQTAFSWLCLMVVAGQEATSVDEAALSFIIYSLMGMYLAGPISGAPASQSGINFISDPAASCLRFGL